MEKNELRRQKRKLRKSLSVFRILNYSNRIYEALLQEPAYRQADVILAYMSFSSEVDTRFLIDSALKSGKQVAIPKCEDKETIRFYYIKNKEQTAPGTYGIMEPTTEEPVDPEDGRNYLCLLPGVAFDENCNRLGYGGGYYDRFLKQHPRVGRIMLAYELEKTEELLPDETDVPAQVVLTEVRRYSREENENHAEEGELVPSQTLRDGE